MSMILRHSAGLVAAVLSFSTGVFAQTTPPPAPSAQPTVFVLPPLDHRFEGAARVGLMLPGKLTPSNFKPAETSVSPTLILDASWIVHPFFAIGPYLQYTALSTERELGDTMYEGSATWVSAGAIARARFQVSEKALLRVGLSAGPNFISMTGETSSSDYEASGSGLNLGLVADGVLRFSQRFGMSGQLGFLSQVSGSFEVEGDDDEHDFAFKPIFFLAVGPELFL
jgi:hypothetical protein